MLKIRCCHHGHSKWDLGLFSNYFHASLSCYTSNICPSSSHCLWREITLLLKIWSNLEFSQANATGLELGQAHRALHPIHACRKAVFYQEASPRSDQRNGKAVGYTESWPRVCNWPCTTSQPANQSLALSLACSWPQPATPQLKTEKASRIGLGKLLYNLTRQIYFSNYVFSILITVCTTYVKVYTLKTKPQCSCLTYNQSFLTKYLVCVELSLIVS